MGSTEAAIKCIAAAEGWSIGLVVTLPPEASARHSDFVDLIPLAEEAGAKVHFTLNSNDDATIEAVSSQAADYIFVIGWSQICRERFLAINPGKIIGYHPTPLPRLRGRAALPWTILLEEPITAGSLFWLGGDADNGDILDQEFFHVASDETARSLYDRHIVALEAMLNRTLPRLASGLEDRRPQDERFATWAARRTADDGLIDWSDTATTIARLVRAVGDPYPGAFTFHGTDKLTIWRAEPVPGKERHHAAAGQVVARGNGHFMVQTGNGLLEIVQWETESGEAPPMHSCLGGSAR